MSEQDKKIEGHSYDGIEELDNSLPRWWLYLFYLTILFSGFYLLHYHLGSGQSISQEYELARASAEQAQKTGAGGSGLPDEKSFAVLIKQESHISEGKAVFAGKCVSCHGAQGQGGIGPNLTDDYWIHGGKPLEIAAVIKNGVLDKGMPPWGPLLKDSEVISLVAYIKSLKGSNPAGAKAPQGEKVSGE